MNILTFDIEEWFHILDNESTNNEKKWPKFESRIHSNMDKIFKLLDNSGFSASFFVVGWIASKYPEIVKKIDRRGYHIGTHSNMHQLIYNQSKSEFDNDLKKSIIVLEDLIGKKIDAFRAPGFSINETNKWAIDILYKNGIKYDCSIFPTKRSHGGFKSFPTDRPSLIRYNGITIKEFPINIKKVLLMDWIYSGGGYFRVTPYYFINKWSKDSEYIMSYFHPRDFDPDQPIINDLSYFRKFKSYVGLNKCYDKLEKWLMDYKFIDLREADNKTNWKNSNVINL